MNTSPLIIDILRHGETHLSGRFCGSSDPDLTELGWAQLQAQTAGSSWQSIISSPLNRCAAYAVSLDPRAQIDPRFQEMHFGDWEGRHAEEIWAKDAKALEAFWADPDAHPAPSGERWGALQARVAEGFADLVSNLADGAPHLLVTHAGVMRALLVSQLGLSFTSSWKISLPLGSMMRLSVHRDADTGNAHIQLLSLKGTA